MSREKILETEILIDPYRGIYLKTTYYSDGTQTEEKIPKGKIIIPESLVL